MRAIPSIAVDFVATHEGIRTLAYRDSAGIPTIGYGHIEGVQMGDRCTKAQALKWLAEDMQAAVMHLYGAVKAEVIADLTEHQWAALLSFVFNLGCEAKWTIWKRLNKRQFDQVPGELIKFVNAGSQKIQGLVNRRADEVKLWSTEEPGSTTEKFSSAETRAVETPPTPGSPTPPQRSPTIITAAVGVVSAVPVAVQQVTQAVAPYADKSEIIQKLVAILATVGAAAVVASLVFAWIKKRRERT